VPFATVRGAPARPRELGHSLKAAVVNVIATQLAARLAPGAFGHDHHQDGKPK
jgi:hypothetical protein